MPTTYAHWRFGQACLKKMPKKYKTYVLNNMDIYNLGVHGPDIFFYALDNKDISEYGSEMHLLPGKDFFERCRIVYKTHKEKEAILSYILGFLSHYTLDSVCHAYVNEKKDYSHISHNKIEAEYDKYLIELDKRKPTSVNRSETLKPNEQIANVISYFHPYDTQATMKSLKMQKFIVGLMTCKYDIKRNILNKILLNKQLYDYSDLLIYKEEFEPCKDSNLRLEKLANKALEKYPKLLTGVLDYMFKDKPLPNYFNNNFEGCKEFSNMPILTYEEEKEFTI